MTRFEDNVPGFLSRWLRRKQNEKHSEEAEESQVDTNIYIEANQAKEDDLSLPIGHQKGVDPDIKKQLLNNLFQQPEFNNCDGLNDYDEDFTSFGNLGEIITEEMRRMFRLENRKKQTETQLSTHKVVAQVNNLDINKNNNDEDNKLA